MGCGKSKKHPVIPDLHSSQKLRKDMKSYSSKNVIVVATHGNIKEFYEIGKVIGKGTIPNRLIWRGLYRKA
jgi:hypothetical protein